MTSDFKSIDDYIAQQSERNVPLLEKIRKIIKEVAPDAEETICYQIFYFEGEYANLKKTGWQNTIDNFKKYTKQ